MIGLLAFLADTGFTIAIPISTLGAFVHWWRHKRLLTAIYGLTILAVFFVIAEPFVLFRYYRKLTGYLVLSGLEFDRVQSISVGSTTWSNTGDIQQVVAALHRSNWLLPSHSLGSSGPQELLTVTLITGEVFRACVGRHFFGGGSLRDEGVIKYIWSGSDCETTDGLALVPELPALLEHMGHFLPK
jgi:hypothetical protein